MMNIVRFFVVSGSGAINAFEKQNAQAVSAKVSQLFKVR
jgi:hypothetical protein